MILWGSHISSSLLPTLTLKFEADLLLIHGAEQILLKRSLVVL